MLIDIKGKRYGRLVVTKFSFVKNESAYWECLCDCGNKKIIKGYSLRSGTTKSCECLHREIARALQKKTNYKHGLSHSRIDIVFKGIQSRCNKKANPAYKNYGGRGIKCEWKSVVGFFKDMGSPPSKKYSIDRIDNNGNYSKKNCRWATKSEQALNRRTAHLITYKSKTQNMKTWAKELGIKNSVLWWRIKKGWSIERAFIA